MDDRRFDNLAKILADPASRRSTVRALGGGALGAVLGLLGLADTEAGKKKKGKGKGKGKGKKKKKSCSGSRKCGKNCCGNGQFCCDDARKVCCANGSECCNPGSGSGSCCSSPNRCGQPYGNDAAAHECCPPERQWFTTTGLVRCCPAGTRSLGTGITAEDGPCCPETKFCGDTCCSDSAPVCVDPATGRCCTEAAACGNTCCPTDWCFACVGGTSCQSTCGDCQFCNGAGGCEDCGVGCCAD